MRQVKVKAISFFLAFVFAFSLLITPIAYAVIPAAILEALGAGANAVGIGSFIFNMYDRWQDAHPNADPSEYDGYTGGTSVNRGGFSGKSGSFSSDPCASSPNGLHNYVKRNTTINNQEGTYWVCEYCGRHVDTDFDAAYQDSVDSLQFKQINSDGSFLYTLVADSYYLYSPTFYSDSSDSNSGRHNFSSTIYSLTYSDIYNNPCDGPPSVTFYYTFPFSSQHYTFSVYKSGSVSCTGYGHSSGDLLYNSVDFDFSPSNSSRYVSNLNPGNSALSYTLVFTYPIFKVTPNSGVINITNDTTYNTNTRTGSITGDYGIIGDNNQVTVVENQTIVNEAEGTYTNPATGRTLDLGSWSYDYGDRSYTLDLTDSEIPVTVRYGDDNVTIVEGDTTYEIYYIIQQEQVDPVTCDHDYSSTITTQPTCTLPGVRTYTCSLCGNSYTESIPANGHTWQVKTSVQTEYDANGDLVTQGYTIFRCSVCGEEYRSEDGTAPPGNSNISGDGDGTSLWSKLGEVLGTIFGGIFKFFVSFLEKVVDALKGLADIISGLFSSVLELFDGFTDFLVGVFPFLPEEFITILTLALVLLVAAGIIRRFLR